jgi:DMSO/TMAO reductase YedYZ molybdopterin-dependent catalytic subunit
MKWFSRRDALRISGSTLAGLSITGLKPEALRPQAAPQSQEFPQSLVEQNQRELAPLPLNADGSAPGHPDSAAGAIRGRLMWRPGEGRERGVTPPGEYDYRQMRIRVDSRSLARLRGTMTFEDLERLPFVSQTFLLQCGTPEPTGIVKWGGVRFSDFAQMIGLQPGAHYARFIATDMHVVDEAVQTLMHPQVMLVWMMNDAPLPPDHGAPLRLVVPFRYGNRSIKAITDIQFGSPSLPAPPTG